MHAWVEFYCTRCTEIHRLAFRIVAYTKYYQHQQCPEGWQPEDGSVCIHDYAIRVAKEGKPHAKVSTPYQKGARKYRKPLKSTLYCPKETTTKTILEHLKQYIIEYYRAEPRTVNIEVDFT